MAENTQSLYNFMQQLNENNVRTQNLFEMRVHVPDSLTAYAGLDGKAIQEYLNPRFTFYGQGFELPARTLQYADVGFKGFKVPVPTVMSMTQEHTVTINADINGDMRRAFLAWQALTMNGTIGDGRGDGGGTVGYFEGNRRLKDVGKLYIALLDPIYGDAHRAIETYTIYGVTVEEVGTMTFSNVDAGIATFTVKFRSQYWQYGIENEFFGNPKDVDLQFTAVDRGTAKKTRARRASVAPSSSSPNSSNT